MPLPNEMDYGIIQRTPDGSGMFLVTTPGSPNEGSYETEQDLKNWIIAAVGGAIIPKGDILSSNLPTPSDSNKGWQYYCTDINKWATSDGTQWVMTSNSIIVQTPDATDTGHALSNAVVTQCCNEVKANINALNARVTNLEQTTKQDEQTVSYPDDGNYSSIMPDGVPARVAKFAEVPTIKGKTRAWNQLVQNGNFASTSGWESSGATISASNNVLSFTASAQGGFVRLSSGNAVRFNKNDILLATFMIKGTSSTTIQYTCQNNNYIFNESVSVTTSWKQVTLRSDATGSDTQGYIFFLDNRESGWDTIYIKEVCIYNLTLIFGAGNEPSTVADALAQLPALGQYNAYDAGSLVDTVVSGVESVGVNIWDEEWENKVLNGADGTKYSYPNSICSKNPVKVFPNTTYYFKVASNSRDRNLLLCEYSADGTYLGYYIPTINNPTYTTRIDTAYIQFYWDTSDNVGEYDHTFQICLNSLPDAIKTTYHPYKTDTLSLPETVTLKSAGSVADELDMESGVVTRKVGKKKLNELTFSKDSSYVKVFWTRLTSELKSGSTNIILPRFKTVGNSIPAMVAYSVNTFNYLEEYEINIRVTDDYYDNHTSAQFLEDFGELELAYELATPTTESIDPVSDNFLEVEGGGTVETIQTQTPVIDNCLDVTYDFIPA